MQVDVVLPTFEPDPKELDRAVDSILNQENTSPNLIVVDDSETDIVKGFVDSLEADATYLRGPGTTLAEALNKGIQAGEAELVARQDADDISNPLRLATQRRKFKQNEELDLIGTGAKIHRPSGDVLRRHVKEHLSSDDFTAGNPIIHGSVMFRRAAFDEVGGYNDRFPTSEDLELWVRMITEGLELRNMDVPLYELHLHDDSIYADQLRDTKLFGQFAVRSAQGEVNTDLEQRILEENDIEALYREFSAQEKRRFHREMAIELLRYGNRQSARENAIKALKLTPRDIGSLGPLLLSVAPMSVVEYSVQTYRVLKNFRVKRANSRSER